MGAGTAIPLEEYLAHSYEPDCEYVDGQIVERNVGEFFHSLLQGALVTHLNLLQYRAGKQSYYVLPECRAKVRGGDDSRRRYRIPDISVMPIRSAPASIILEPPLVVIEILSPEDRFHAVVQKCADYEAFRYPGNLDRQSAQPGSLDGPGRTGACGGGSPGLVPLRRRRSARRFQRSFRGVRFERTSGLN